MGLKHHLRRRLWALGLDVSRLDPSSRPVWRSRRLLDECGIDLVLDVGASAGRWAQDLRDEVGFTGLIRSFEPRSAAFRELSALAAKDVSWDVFNFALGDADGEEPMNIAGNSDSSSLLEMLPAHEDAAPQSRYVGQEIITVRTLDGIFDEICPPDAAVYLKVDTQGYEGRVLRGARRVLSKIELVRLEMPLVPLYEGESTLIQLLEFMRAEGYVLVGLDPGFTDPRTGRLLQADGLFLRDQPHA